MSPERLHLYETVAGWVLYATADPSPARVDAVSQIVSMWVRKLNDPLVDEIGILLSMGLDVVAAFSVGDALTLDDPPDDDGQGTLF